MHWLNGGEATADLRAAPPLPSGACEAVRPWSTTWRPWPTWPSSPASAPTGIGSLGTADDPGTALVTLTGDLAGPGVYEIPLGIPLAEVLRRRRAGTSSPRPSSSAATPAAWIPGPTAAQITLDSASLGRVDASLGCGAITVVGPGSLRPARPSADITTWMADQSAGQCGPCVHGLPAIAHAVEAPGRRRSRPPLGETAAPLARHGRRPGRLPPPRRDRPHGAQRPDHLRRRDRQPSPPRRLPGPTGRRCPPPPTGGAGGDPPSGRQSHRLRRARPVRRAPARTRPSRRLGLPPDRPCPRLLRPGAHARRAVSGLPHTGPADPGTLTSRPAPSRIPTDAGEQLSK